MTRQILILIFSSIIFLTNCKTVVDKEDEEELPLQNLAIPDNQWVAERVEEAKLRLQKTEGGNLVWNAIIAHGGLDNWFKNGPLSFRFNYQPLGEGTNRDTYQVVDTWSSRAVHHPSGNDSVTYGWDGKESWIQPKDAEINYDTRFWALTPYYFVGIPFVFADSGTNFEKLQDITFENTNYHQVKVSYDEGIGDAPDDYYIIYIHPDNYKVDAIRYVVSYPGYFPDGGHSPEKLMTYENKTEVEGILLHQRHRTYKWDTASDSVSEQVTEITVSKIEFRPEIKNEYFNAPK